MRQLANYKKHLSGESAKDCSILSPLSSLTTPRISVLAGRSHGGASREFPIHVFRAGVFLQCVCHCALFQNASVGNICLALCFCKTVLSKRVIHHGD